MCKAILLGSLVACLGLPFSEAKGNDNAQGTAGAKSATSAPPAKVSPLSPADAAAGIDRSLHDELFRDLPASAPQPASKTDDETFLRRLNLDLVGQLPTPQEVTTFALDPSADKRAKMATLLLSKPRFGQNWGRYFRDVIFYRKTEERSQLAAGTVEGYLTKALNANEPWDKTAQSFIEAKGVVAENGATAFYIAHGGSTEDITSEISRVFMGVQIQCAQCHDHPTDRWKRKQFHELAAFFPRAELRPVKLGQPFNFEVVSLDRERRFKPKNNNERRGELEHYMPDLKEPTAKGTLMTPTFFLTGAKLSPGATDDQRRRSIARWITSKQNPWFAKAFVNRIWAELVGEGFYEPVDDLGPDRVCSAPATMEFLAGQFVANGFDIKWLFETIVRCDTYQRVSQPRRNPDETPFLANRSQPLRADQVFDVVTSALGADGAAIEMAGAPGGRRRGVFGARGAFQETFGFDPSERREEISGSIPQALLLMNSPFLQRALNARTPNSSLGTLLASTKDDEQVIVELYLRCLAREPNEREIAACRDHVLSVGNRVEGMEDIVWALVNRAEFLHRD